MANSYSFIWESFSKYSARLRLLVDPAYLKSCWSLSVPVANPQSTPSHVTSVLWFSGPSAGGRARWLSLTSLCEANKADRMKNTCREWFLFIVTYIAVGCVGLGEFVLAVKPFSASFSSLLRWISTTCCPLMDWKGISTAQADGIPVKMLVLH